MVGATVVHGRDKRWAERSVATQLKIDLGVDIVLGHAMFQVLQYLAKGRFGDGTGAAHYLNVVRAFDLAQWSNQFRRIGKDHVRDKLL